VTSFTAWIFRKQVTVKTITGTFLTPGGAPAAGATLRLQLSQDATILGLGQIAPLRYYVTLNSEGQIPAGTTIWPNDNMTPSGTYYTATLTMPGFERAYGPEVWQISGSSPINLNNIPAGQTAMGMSVIIAGDVVVSGIPAVGQVLTATSTTAADWETPLVNTGPQGPQGIQGIPGAASTVPGPTGATGAQGIQGVTGSTGPTGADGADGAPGSTGATGTQGIPGTAGSTGATGAQGIPGTAGATGAAGTAGATGAAGATGPAGPAPTGTANLVLATPNGTSGTAALRSLVAADIPALGYLSTAHINDGVTTAGQITITEPTLINKHAAFGTLAIIDDPAFFTPCAFIMHEAIAAGTLPNGCTGLYTLLELNPSLDVNGGYGISASSSMSNITGTHNIASGIFGTTVGVTNNSTAGNNPGGMYGIFADVENYGPGTVGFLAGQTNYLYSSGVVGEMTGFMSGVNNDGTVALASGFHFVSGGAAIGGTVTNQYGLLVDDVLGATNNYAIKTGLGKVQLADAVKLTGITGHGTAGSVAIATDGTLSVSAPVFAPQTVTASLTTAQIKTLHTVPVVLVPAPGAGFYIQLYDALFYLTYGGTAFDVASNDGNSLQLIYGTFTTENTGDDNAGWSAIPNTSSTLVQTASGGVLVYFTEGNLGYVMPLSVAANQPLNLFLGTRNLTVGNSTLKVKLRYEIRPTTL
jgi:hypothetical protein